MSIKGILIIVAALVTAATPARASLAVALVTADRVVVASDSRTWGGLCDCFAGDTARKVDVQGDFAFFMTGAPLIWSVWESNPPRPGEYAADVARRLLGSATPDDIPQDFTFGIVRFGAPVDSYVARVRLHPDGRAEMIDETFGPELAPPYVLALGWDDNTEAKRGLMDTAHAELRRAPGEARMIAIAQGFLAAGARHSEKIGGPSHVAVVDASGSRWHKQAVREPRPREPRDLHWDGTKLTIRSANLKIDDTGIFITPSSSFDDSRAYAFTVTDGLLRLGGLLDSTHQGIGLQNAYSGSTVAMEVQSGIDAEYSVSGQPQGLVFVTANASNTEAAVEMLTFRNAGTYNGDIRLGGYLQFLRGAVGTAGGVVGYIEIKDAAGNIFKIPVHNP